MFVARHRDYAAGFTANTRGRYQADLYALARLALRHSGVERILGGSLCTYSDERDFYTFRRDGQTGRRVPRAWLACVACHACYPDRQKSGDARVPAVVTSVALAALGG